MVIIVSSGSISAIPQRPGDAVAFSHPILIGYVVGHGVFWPACHLAPSEFRTARTQQLITCHCPHSSPRGKSDFHSHTIPSSLHNRYAPWHPVSVSHERPPDDILLAYNKQTLHTFCISCVPISLTTKQQHQQIADHLRLRRHPTNNVLLPTTTHHTTARWIRQSQTSDPARHRGLRANAQTRR